MLDQRLVYLNFPVGDGLMVVLVFALTSNLLVWQGASFHSNFGPGFNGVAQQR